MENIDDFLLYLDQIEIDFRVFIPICVVFIRFLFDGFACPLDGICSIFDSLKLNVESLFFCQSIEIV